MNLDDELNRLFADERLDVPVAAGAADAVVAGARKRRQRRVAMTSAGGALGVSLLVAGGIALAGIGGPQSLPPGQTPSSVTTTASAGPSTGVPSGTVAVPDKPTGGSRTNSIPNRQNSTTTPPGSSTSLVSFGPMKGYLGLRLGMTAKEAEATGVITPNAAPTSSKGCLGYDYVGNPKDANHYAVVISPKYGVVRMASKAGALTPEGISPGTSEADMRKAYPTQVGSHGALQEWVTAVPGHADKQYWILVRDGAVSEIRLELKTQDCYA